MRSLALSAIGDFLLVLGVVFFLLGASDFLTAFVGVKGSGGMIIGAALFAVSVVVLLRSRPKIVMVNLKKPEEPKSEDYR
jgi:hypothetical protein